MVDLSLRQEQQDAVTQALQFLDNAMPESRLLFASATGSGKTRVELSILDQRPGGVLLTPSTDIIVSMLKTLGEDIPPTERLLRDLASSHRIYTPLWFRNRLLKGEMEPPAYILWDEVHHQTAESWSDISALCGCPELGFTATPYRGTARGTVKFQSIWGAPNWIYTFPDAVARGFISLPECITVPLLDDDVVEISSGEFQVKSLESVTRSRLLELAALIRSYPLDRPTMVAMPTRAIAHELSAVLDSSVVITGESSTAERQDAFDRMLACKAILVQIAVVGEGVDLPVRRLFDAAATLSPVRWVQLLGRLTRPGGQSQYICTNRNLLRHAYALQGVLPAQVVVEAQQLFGLGTRSGQRAFGLEGLGRFKVNSLPLVNGLQGELYLLENSDKRGNITQYACLLHPLHAEPLWAHRINVAGNYGRWSPVESPEGFTGFASGNGAAITEKQKNWWKRDARRYGLDPEQMPNRRTFAALPVLRDLGLKLEV